jgi:hypothetical protein
MGDKREFLQGYPPDVLLPLDASSDIHYGRNHKIQDVSRFQSLKEQLTEKARVAVLNLAKKIQKRAHEKEEKPE